MSDPRVEVLPIEQGATTDLGNVNKHTVRGGALLENSLRKRGAFRSIASAGKGVEVPVTYAGNYTLEKAVEAGFKEIVNIHVRGDQLVNVVRDDLTPGSPEAIALGLEDNESAAKSYSPDLDILAALAAGDDAILATLRKEDKVFGGMLEGMGLKDEIQDAEPQFDRAAELLEKWQVKTGDLWRIGEHRLLCGDSTKREDVERVTKGECESTIADPPYNVGLDYGEETDDGRTDDVFWRWQASWFDECKHATIRQVITPGCVNLEEWIADFRPNHVAIWDKGEGANTHGRVTKYWAWEPIMCHGKFERKRHTDVFRFSALGENPGHPCPKPVPLWQDIIDSFALGIVYDPFGGSGTTMVACNNLGRKCRMIEIDPKYCAIILQRMSDAFPGIEIERL
jgi:hypothetical protein